jgi:hypothetical protein
MSLSHSPSIVTTGLVFLVDFANPRCYPGTGTAVYDISGNGNIGSLVGSSTVSGGKVTVVPTSGVNFSTVNLSAGTTFTVMGSSRYNGTGASYGRMINGWTNNWLMGHWSGSVNSYYSAGWVNNASGGADTNWRIYHATGNTSSGVYQFYMNDSLVVSGAGGTAGPNGIAIGGVGYTAEYSNGDCGIVAAYNRELTASEVVQNYTAFRGRYGI